jgi:hypothetical protein
MELVVASLIAMLVISGMYIVFAGHSRVFRGQEMVSQAQMTTRFAMEVVKADLARAGFMAVWDTDDPEVQQHLCGPPPDGRRIQALTHIPDDGAIDSRGVNKATAPARPSEAPDTVILVGNYTNADTYWVDCINGPVVKLQNNSASDPTDPFATYPNPGGAFNQIFDENNDRTLVRIRYQEKVHFARVVAKDWNGGNGPTVDISPAPNCISGCWDGAQLNVVNRVRYRVVDASNSDTGLSPSEAALEAANIRNVLERRNLVREVLEWDTDRPAATEVVAENVVDFQLWWLFADQQVLDQNNGPATKQAEFGLADHLGLPDTSLGSPPCNGAGVALGDNNCPVGNVTGAVVRLSVRTDREDPNFRRPDGVTRPLQWYEIDDNPETGSARVRTLVSQVALPNLVYGKQGYP